MMVIMSVTTLGIHTPDLGITTRLPLQESCLICTAWVSQRGDVRGLGSSLDHPLHPPRLRLDHQHSEGYHARWLFS